MTGFPYTREDIERDNFDPKPMQTYNARMKSVEELKKESAIWKLCPTDYCRLCNGWGHKEIQCGTQKNLDRVAKTMSTEQ